MIEFQYVVRQINSAEENNITLLKVLQYRHLLTYTDHNGQTVLSSDWSDWKDIK